jgi:hypothetical protein
MNNHWETVKEVPATSEISDYMSKKLKKDGFKFVGSTICYSSGRNGERSYFGLFLSSFSYIILERIITY